MDAPIIKKMTEVIFPATLIWRPRLTPPCLSWNTTDGVLTSIWKIRSCWHLARNGSSHVCFITLTSTLTTVCLWAAIRFLWRFLQRSLVSGFYTTAPDRKKCCSVLQKSIHLATRYFHHWSPTTRCYSALILLTCSTKNGRTRGIHPFHLWNLSSISMGGPKKNISIVSLNYLHC